MKTEVTSAKSNNSVADIGELRRELRKLLDGSSMKANKLVTALFLSATAVSAEDRMLRARQYCRAIRLNEVLDFTDVDTQQPLCLSVGALPNAGSINFALMALPEEDTNQQRVCAKADALTDDGLVRDLSRCGTGKVTLPLMAPTHPYSYAVFPGVTHAGPTASYRAVAYAGLQPAPSPPLQPEQIGAGAPPSPPTPPRRCGDEWDALISSCAADLEQFCPEWRTEEDVLECLHLHDRSLSDGCIVRTPPPPPPSAAAPPAPRAPLPRLAPSPRSSHPSPRPPRRRRSRPTR